MFKVKQNQKGLSALTFSIVAIPQLAMAAGGGEPEVSINQWGVIGLVVAICIAYKVLKK